MRRYEVSTPAGYLVAVPRRVWMAWPSGHRRAVNKSPLAWLRERALEKTFDADALKRERENLVSRREAPIAPYGHDSIGA